MDTVYSLRRFFLALCFRLLRRLHRWLFAFFVGIDGVEHVVIEAVAAIVAVFAEIKIDFRALGQPESVFFLGNGMGPYSTTWCSLRSWIAGIGVTISASMRTIWNLSALIQALPFSGTE